MCLLFCFMMFEVVKIFDYFVIGGGFGGLVSVRRVFFFGVKVVVIEYGRFGGICVGIVCVI